MQTVGMRGVLLLALLALSLPAQACAGSAANPRSAGDRCLYASCPDGSRCVGAGFGRWRASPGRCVLEVGRCLAPSDCREREHCVRPGEAVGLCRTNGLL
jgi:hypothetical protein